MSRKKTTAAAPDQGEPTSAPSAPVAAAEADAPAVPAPDPEPAAEGQPEPSPAPSEAPAPDPAPSDAAPDAVSAEPPAQDPEPEALPAPLRTDGPTLAEWVAAGYLAEHYPPEGYAAKADAPAVEYYRVTTYCRYVADGVVCVWQAGLVIDSLNFNIADVKAQGCPIEPCDASAANLKPSIGHWSV